MGLPRTPGLESPTKSEFVGQGTISPSKNQASARKLRNATPRQHDIEFAADIGQGLLEEVRKLQALLAQKDQKLNEATASISRSDRQIELLDRKVKQMHEDQGLFKSSVYFNRRISEGRELEHASPKSRSSKSSEFDFRRDLQAPDGKYAASRPNSNTHLRS